MASPSNSAVLAVAPDIVFGDVNGEVVALRVDADAYLHLNSTGSYVFEQLREQPQSLDALCGAVAGRYDVDADTCLRETSAFVARCVEIGLLLQMES